MALIKHGPVVAGISGSIGGTTFARNRYGAYMRNRTKPINPNTASQQVVRATMAFLTDRWSQTLTAAQRTAWNLYGASVVMLNRLGENINLTGFNHYIRSNSILKRSGRTLVDAGPTIFEVPQADPTLSITASEATQQITVTFDDTLAWNNEDNGWMHIFQGTPQNAQRNFFAGPWHLFHALSGALAGGAVSPAASGAWFTITEGQRVWIYARITRADGRTSEPFRADTFIAA